MSRPDRCASGLRGLRGRRPAHRKGPPPPPTPSSCWGEIAHPDVFNLLLQALDDGKMTDSPAATSTSRTPCHHDLQHRRPRPERLRQASGSAKACEESRDETNRGIIEKALKKAFRPEFLNPDRRHRDVQQPEARRHPQKIIDIELRHPLQAHHQRAGLRGEADRRRQAFLVRRAGREVRRPPEARHPEAIEDLMAEEIINQSIEEGDNITVASTRTRATRASR